MVSIADVETGPPRVISREALATARGFAAAVFAANARQDLAQTVVRGAGDDFPEVRAAIEAVGLLGDRLARQEDALRHYADPSFWDDDLPGGSLALHDRGEMARNVLGGRRPFFHRD